MKHLILILGIGLLIAPFVPLSYYAIQTLGLIGFLGVIGSVVAVIVSAAAGTILVIIWFEKR